MRASELVQLLRDAYRGWSDDDASRLAAALAFYTIFAIAPLLIIVIEIGAALLGGAGHNAAVRDQILDQLRPAIGDAGTKAIADLVQATFNQRSQGRFASIVAWVLFAVAASGLIVAVQDALDTIWHLKVHRGIVQTIVDRLKALGIIGCAAILVVALVCATGAVTTLAHGIATKILSGILIAALITLITAAVYKLLPNVRLSWRDVWVGAIASSILSVVGQYLIGFYLGRAATTSAYGAAGSLFAVLLWLYYSNQLFLFGAELTKAYANRFGSLRKRSASVERGSVESPLPA